MGEDISNQLVQLPTLSREQLFALWQRLYRRPAPRGIRRELLIPFLAYRIQENAYGGLKSSTLAELHRIARGIKNSSSAARVSRPKLKSGTRVLRQWRGETHEVVVTQSGFQYRQASYKSLSEIARKITGTRWSGPAFFGLNKSKSDPRHRDD